MEIEYNDRGNPFLHDGADLSKAIFREADLGRADLRGANLKGVKFPEGYGKLPTNKEG